MLQEQKHHDMPGEKYVSSLRERHIGHNTSGVLLRALEMDLIYPFRRQSDEPYLVKMLEGQHTETGL